MAEVPDHLVPRDGLTNSTIRFEGMYSHPNSGHATFSFKMRGEQGDDIGVYNIIVAPNADGSVDQMIDVAHREMIDVLRQWIFELNILKGARERAAAR